MNRLRWGLTALLTASGLTGIWAQDAPPVEETLIIYASKTETELAELGATAFVITAEEIERRQWRTVAEALHAMPGVSLAQTGADGGIATLFLRGANSQNTLALMDGARLNDASGVARGYDFAHLSTAGVERIELILGPQSALYGSDASAGVVNIITKRGVTRRLQFAAESSTEEDQRQRFDAGDDLGLFDYSVAFEHEDRQSLSARTDGFPRQAATLEEDSYRATRARANLGFQLSERGRLELGATRIDADIDLDAVDGDDPNNVSDNEQTALHLRYEHSAANGRWRYGLYAARAQTDRTNLDETDAFHPADAIDSRFEGVNDSLEARGTFQINASLQLTAGLAAERESGEGDTVGSSAFGPFTSTFDDDADIDSLFAQARISLENGVYANAGARYDDHSQFGGEATYQASLGWRGQAGTHLRGFYGTGFQAPSIFQLFSSFGNAELKEETSRNWELSAAQDLGDGKFRFGATYFDNRYENLIDFYFNPETFFGSYLNIDEVDTSGYELFAEASLGRFEARLAYDNLDAQDVSPDPGSGRVDPQPLLRRHDDKAALLLSGEASSRLAWNLDILRYGEAWDVDAAQFGAPAQLVDAYTLVHFGATCRVSDHVSLNLRARNLLDEEYTRVIGYAVHGRRLFLGATINY